LGLVTEIDAADVLTSYTALLLKGRALAIRDAGELPYPKDVIKDVLLYSIGVANGKNREFLLGAYVSLADFQVLTPAEKSAVETAVTITELKDLDALSNDQLRQAAEQVAVAQPVVAILSKRVSEESANLVNELKSAGIGSQRHA
jgi:hypothetical protein